MQSNSVAISTSVEALGCHRSLHVESMGVVHGVENTADMKLWGASCLLPYATNGSYSMFGSMSLGCELDVR